MNPTAKMAVFLFLLLVGAAYIFIAAFGAGTLGVNEGFQDLLIIIAFLSPSPMQTGGTTINNHGTGTPGVVITPAAEPAQQPPAA
jgi:hypothetical protein